MTRNPLKNYYVWCKDDLDNGDFENHTRVESFHPEVAGAMEAYAQAMRSFCEQPDHDYTTCQDYIEVCLVVSEYPDATAPSEYWFRVDIQMVRKNKEPQ